MVLDLGKVDVIASLDVNGQSFGDLWQAPFAADVTAALHPGKNELKVKVANLWTNRLIADAALPEAKRLTWTNYRPLQSRCAPIALGSAWPRRAARRGVGAGRGSFLEESITSKTTGASTPVQESCDSSAPMRFT